MRVVVAAYRLQLQIIRRNPDYLLNLATTPILAVIFLSIVRHAGRDELVGHAVMAPVLIALWGISLFVAGEIIVNDRFFGTFEALVATPASFPVTVVARIFAVTSLGLFAFAEVWLVARLGFGLPISVSHPHVLVLTLVVSAVAMSGTALIMAAVFAFGRRARPFQRVLTYPFYMLGGVLVPVALLPDWVRPLSRVVFLSWSSELLRDALSEAAVENFLPRLAAILALGFTAFVVGWILAVKVLDVARAKGTLAEI